MHYASEISRVEVHDGEVQNVRRGGVTENTVLGTGVAVRPGQPSRHRNTDRRTSHGVGKYGEPLRIETWSWTP